MEVTKFQKSKHFEEKIVQALILDHAFAEQMLEVLNVEYFNTEYLKELTKLFFGFYEEYKAFPSFKTLVLVVKDKIQSEVFQGQVINYLVKIKNDPLNGDGEYIKEESLDFCKKRSLALALEESLNCIDEKKFDQIVPIIQKALVAGSEREIGHIFEDEDSFEKRMTDIVRNPIPTPWEEVDKITQGGFAAGELWCAAGPTGVGKSLWLVDVGHHAALMGYNVAHYTLELSDLMIGRRYDARYSGVPMDQLNLYKDRVWNSLQDVKGSIIIKSYPCKSASALTIKSHIHKLTMKDRKPDLILVDYGDLMRSRKSYDQKRFEEEAIYEDLRNLAGELQLPVVTVTQTNRSSLDEEVITLKHVAECFQKAMISDVFITIMRRKQNSLETPGNFFIAKNRLGPDGMKFNTMTNTSISKFRILSAEEQGGEEEEGPEERLRAKFRDFKNKNESSDED
jgi:replicative DNA helicase